MERKRYRRVGMDFKPQRFGKRVSRNEVDGDGDIFNSRVYCAGRIGNSG